MASGVKKSMITRIAEARDLLTLQGACVWDGVTGKPWADTEIHSRENYDKLQDVTKLLDELLLSELQSQMWIKQPKGEK
jgi:hypothetical protein